MSTAIHSAALPDLLRGVNLYLIGMMGAGKSTLGKAMAQRLGYRFLDTDAVVEQVAGHSIADLFQTVGKSGFRDLESQVLDQVAPYTRLVVATGGGIVLRQQNWSYLHQGIVVWIDVPLPELQRRLQGDRHRPLLQRPDWPQHLAQLLAARQAWYAAADVHLAVKPGDSPEQLCDRLIDLLQQRILPPDPPETAPDD